MELSHSQHVCWRLNQPMRALLPEGTWRQPSGVHWFLKGSCEFLQRVMDAATSTTLTGSRQRRGQRSEVRGRGAAEVINVMNTPESEGRGHSEEHSGLPPSASPSRVLPSRLINYWESQPESSVCVCVCVCVCITPAPSSHVCCCHDNTVYGAGDGCVWSRGQTLLFRLYSNRRLLVCLCWCFTSLIHTLILNLTELIYFVSSDFSLWSFFFSSLSLLHLFSLSMNLEAGRAAAIAPSSN